MNKSKVVIIILLVILLVILSRYALIAEDAIKDIKMSYTDFKICVQGELDEDIFINPKYYKYLYIERVTVKNDSLFANILDQINRIHTPINIEACDNIRLVLIIIRKSGVIDTLSFGECFTMVYNHKFYKPSIALLKILIPMMKKNYQSDYYNYINELEKYFKCE